MAKRRAMTSGIAEFWGKARSDLPGVDAAHPLVAHALDVAAVAVLIFQQKSFGIDPRMLGLLVSLHDLGKFSRPFQFKVQRHWPVGMLGAYPAAGCPRVPSTGGDEPFYSCDDATLTQCSPHRRG